MSGAERVPLRGASYRMGGRGRYATAAGVGLAVIVIGLVARPAAAFINLDYRPNAQTVLVGETVNIGLYAISDRTVPQEFNSLDLQLSWDTSRLELLGVDDTGTPLNLSGGFALGALNEVLPPADGNGTFSAFADLQTTVPAAPGPNGTLVTTLRFRALAPTLGTVVAMHSSLLGWDTFVGYPPIPGMDIKGTLDPGANVVIELPEPASLGLLIVGACLLAGGRRPGSALQ